MFIRLFNIHSRKRILMIVFLVVTAIIAGIILIKSKDSTTGASIQSNDIVANIPIDNIDKNTNETNNKNTEDKNNNPPNTEKIDTDAPPLSDEYILPTSNVFLLKEEKLRNWDKYSLKLARNEIYARHGFIFTDSSLKEYFESQSWYKPAPDYTGELSEIELKNAELIKKVEAMDEKNKAIAVSQKGILEFDLNGDGKRDKISYKFITDENGYPTKYQLSVNDSSVTQHDDNGLEEFKIVDFDATDKYLEIAIEENGPSDDLATTFYYYDGKDLQLMGKVGGHCGNNYSVKGDRKVTSVTRSQILMTWFYFDEFNLTAERKLQHITKDFYASTWNPKLIAKMELPLYKSRTEKDISVTLLPGDRIYLLGTDDKEWCLAITEDGKEGWFAVEKGTHSIIRDIGKNSYEVFEGAIMAD
jgi:hypothetical protein